MIRSTTAVSVALAWFLFVVPHAAAAACEDDAARLMPSFPPTTIDHCYGADGWNYNRSLVSRHYGLYAAMANDAYVDDRSVQRSFRVGDDDAEPGQSHGKTGWSHRERSPHFSNGLVYDVYYARRLRRPGVVVAFRGTDGFLDVDTFSNASWIFGWFFCDQYCLAEQKFAEVVARARRELGPNIDVVVTGHSLGGGLARHVASIFADVSSVTFNSSFVTNTATAPHAPRVGIRVYEAGEFFGGIDRGCRGTRLCKSRNTAEDGDYRTDMSLVNAQGIDNVRQQHNIENLAAGLLRSAVLCRSEGDAECPGRDDVSLTLFCRYIGGRVASDELREKTIVCPGPGVAAGDR